MANPDVDHESNTALRAEKGQDNDNPPNVKEEKKQVDLERHTASNLANEENQVNTKNKNGIGIAKPSDQDCQQSDARENEMAENSNDSDVDKESNTVLRAEEEQSNDNPPHVREEKKQVDLEGNTASNIANKEKQENTKNKNGIGIAKPSDQDCQQSDARENEIGEDLNDSDVDKESNTVPRAEEEQSNDNPPNVREEKKQVDLEGNTASNIANEENQENTKNKNGIGFSKPSHQEMQQSDARENEIGEDLNDSDVDKESNTVLRAEEEQSNDNPPNVREEKKQVDLEGNTASNIANEEKQENTKNKNGFGISKPSHQKMQRSDARENEIGEDLNGSGVDKESNAVLRTEKEQRKDNPSNVRQEKKQVDLEGNTASNIANEEKQENTKNKNGIGIAKPSDQDCQQSDARENEIGEDLNDSDVDKESNTVLRAEEEQSNDNPPNVREEKKQVDLEGNTAINIANEEKQENTKNKNGFGISKPSHQEMQQSDARENEIGEDLNGSGSEEWSNKAHRTENENNNENPRTEKERKQDNLDENIVRPPFGKEVNEENHQSYLGNSESCNGYYRSVNDKRNDVAFEAGEESEIREGLNESDVNKGSNRVSRADKEQNKSAKTGKEEMKHFNMDGNTENIVDPLFGNGADGENNLSNIGISEDKEDKKNFYRSKNDKRNDVAFETGEKSIKDKRTTEIMETMNQTVLDNNNADNITGDRLGQQPNEGNHQSGTGESESSEDVDESENVERKKEATVAEGESTEDDQIIVTVETSKQNDYDKNTDSNIGVEVGENSNQSDPEARENEPNKVLDDAKEISKDLNEPQNVQRKDALEAKKGMIQDNLPSKIEAKRKQDPNTKGSQLNDLALEAEEEGIEDNLQSKIERQRKHKDFEEKTDKNMGHELGESEEADTKENEINKHLNKSDEVKENIKVHIADKEQTYDNMPTEKESSSKHDDVEGNTENLPDTPEREISEGMHYSDLAHWTDEERMKNNPSNNTEENSKDDNLEENKADVIVLGLEKKSDHEKQSTDKEEKFPFYQREDKKQINNKNISKTKGDDSGIYSEETIEQDTAIGLENESNVENPPTQAEETETQADLKKDKDRTGKQETLREERLTQDALAEELSKYEMKNKELTEIIRTREEEIEDLNRRLEDQNHTLRDANNEIERFESDLENKNEIIRTREEEIEDLNRRLEDQNHTHADLLHRIIAAEKSADEFSELRRELEAVNNDNQSLRGRLSASEESNRNMEKKQQELERGKQEKEKLHKELLEKNRTIQVLQSQNEQCKNDLQANNLKLENLKKESAQKEATNKTALEMIKQEKEKLQNELLGRNSIIQGLQSENQRSKRDLDATAMENAQLKGKLSDMQTTVTQLKAYLEKTEATKTSAIESMQKAITERDHMTIQMGTLQTLKMEKENLHRNYELLLEQNTKLNASVQEYGLLQNHIQEYYKAWQESQMELHTEREKNRHFNELFSKNGHRMSSMITDIQNYRRMADDNRRLLEEKKEECHRKERELDRLKYEISNKEIDLGKYTEENFELKDQNKSLEEELNRSQSECSQLRDHVHSLSMNQTGLQDAPDGDVRGSSLFQGTGFSPLI
uniref:Myb-like protein X isoform X2 n=1 Tax=Crassostrea virginica TaxID=6565 RepID=A0A8B8AM99_CRAVI|nr:myb-like protein X isoform X2 [Crassostrea virginica]